MTFRETAKLHMYQAVAALCDQPGHAEAIAKIPDFDAAWKSFRALRLPDAEGQPVDPEALTELFLEGDLCLERMDEISSGLLAEFPAFVSAYDLARLIGHRALSSLSSLSVTTVPGTSGANGSKKGGKRPASRSKALGRHRLPAAEGLTS